MQTAYPLSPTAPAPGNPHRHPSATQPHVPGYVRDHAAEFAAQVAALLEVARSCPVLSKDFAVSIAEADYTDEIARKVSGHAPALVDEAGKRLAHAVILYGAEAALEQAIGRALRDKATCHAVLVAYEAAAAVRADVAALDAADARQVGRAA